MKRLIIIPFLSIAICFSSCELIAFGWYEINESHKKRDALWDKEDFDYHIYYIRFSCQSNPRLQHRYTEDGLSPMIPYDTIINYYDIHHTVDFLYNYEYPIDTKHYKVGIGNKKELPITISDKNLIEKYIDNDVYDSVFIYWMSFYP